MTKMNVSVFSLVAVAGSISSVALAQDLAVDQAQPARVIGTVSPSFMIYKGKQYPVKSHGVTDTNNIDVYTNTPAAAFYTTSSPDNHIMDEITFYPGPGEGAGQLINGVFFTFGFNSATVPADPNHSVAVRFRIWDTVNILLGTATNNVSNNDGTVTFVFTPPAAGWTLNGFYNTGVIDISTIAGGGIQTLDDSIAVELLMLTTDANNQPTTTINSEMTTLMGDFSNSFANTVGSSPAAYWRDLANDDIWQSGDGNRTFAYPAVANLVLRLQAKAQPLATGACCLANGTCITASSYECTTSGGVYGGNGTACGTCGSPGTLFANGPLSTGNTSLSGVVAPANSTWSELPTDGSIANTTNGVAIGDTAPPAFRCADNFTISDAGGWDIQDIVFYAYQTVSSATAAPTFKTGTLQIWNGPPNAGGSVVFGDATTNRLAASISSFIYRTGNSTIGASAPSVVRPVFENWLSANTHLGPGTYWVDAQFDAKLPSAGTVTNAAFAPFVTVPGQRSPAGANALQMTAANTWAAVLDAASGTLPQEFPFVVRGSVSQSCYPNCDQSTSPPILNANDFQCFLNKYAAGDTYANCDGSTNPPILNANDFQCFLNKYAAGCS
jgi:hypothetical protein